RAISFFRILSIYIILYILALDRSNLFLGCTSDKCEKICYAIKCVKIFKYKNGLLKCINGAKDLKTGEKRFISFELYYSLIQYPQRYMK
ncbi:hypothetical protein HZS_4145, partial [Henneguya salminicola]